MESQDRYTVFTSASKKFFYAAENLQSNNSIPHGNRFAGLCLGFEGTWSPYQCVALFTTSEIEVLVWDRLDRLIPFYCDPQYYNSISNSKKTIWRRNDLAHQDYAGHEIIRKVHLQSISNEIL
ncbi:hypothetical protein Agabi119p4_1387 [Agaricus bisporus var. burnettii]|uniref:Uncharacterized protein n=1 Tax=Agaricus bisporus var. burnettii TaxID=192524 RepID=A0A8H7FCB8_AGABI|nr:hypothetical protein Agabi119p4_1387 [Agaricus bisporus var. burnettii]